MNTLASRILTMSEKTNLPNGPVIYWMSRDQRVQDNWALYYAQQEAIKRKVPLFVYFAQTTTLLNATQKIFDFMEEGLKNCEIELARLNITFFRENGEVTKLLPIFARKIGAVLVVTDFSPLRIKRQWEYSLIEKLHCSFSVVDAHNIVPPWVTSIKQEFSARTIRPKLNKLLPQYLHEIPSIIVHPFGKVLSRNKFSEAIKVSRVTNFLNNIQSYEKRNNPLAHATSMISKQLHFGNISAQKIALQATALEESESRDSFLEELIVRRELAENYCYYNENYDNTEGFPQWAKTTLKLHLDDKRPYLYDLEQFESGNTHEAFWNAIQHDLVSNGYLNGYLRMYWAKKILEWSKSPEEAQQIAIKLNDSYQYDGRDPNGYAGIAWSIGGLHDRPWFNRPIFGLIRYMNENGARRKFNVDQYILENS